MRNGFIKILATVATAAGLLVAVPSTASAQEDMIHLSDCELMLEGQSGTCVALLQLALNTTGAPYNLTPDGEFGASTRIAVLDFQGRNHLDADGNAGFEVTAALIGQVGDLNALDLPGRTEEPPPGPADDSIPCNDPDGGDCDDGGVIAQGKSATECLGEALSDTVTDIIKKERARQDGDSARNSSPQIEPSAEEKDRALRKASRKEQLKVAKELASKPLAVVKIFKCMLWDMPD